MKKNKKLVLNKETVRNLDGAALTQVAGGMPPPTAPGYCTEAKVCNTNRQYCTSSWVC